MNLSFRFWIPYFLSVILIGVGIYPVWAQWRNQQDSILGYSQSFASIIRPALFQKTTHNFLDIETYFKQSKFEGQIKDVNGEKIWMIYTSQVPDAIQFIDQMVRKFDLEIGAFSIFLCNDQGYLIQFRLANPSAKKNELKGGF